MRSGNRFKVLEENIGKKISDIPFTNIFTYISPRARDVKERINKWDFNQNEKLLHGQRKHQQNEKGTYHMGKCIYNDTSDKGLIS